MNVISFLKKPPSILAIIIDLNRIKLIKSEAKGGRFQEHLFCVCKDTKKRLKECLKKLGYSGRRGCDPSVDLSVECPNVFFECLPCLTSLSDNLVTSIQIRRDCTIYEGMTATEANRRIFELSQCLAIMVPGWEEVPC